LLRWGGSRKSNEKEKEKKNIGGRFLFPFRSPRPRPLQKKNSKPQNSEASDLSEGAVRLALLERGEPPTGSNKPAEGDCVVFHLEVRAAPKEGHGGGAGDGPPLFSTRGGGGGGEAERGAPFVALLGPRGAPHRLPRAWELALGDSTPGTRLAVRCDGALYGWGGETCGVAPPASLSSSAAGPSLGPGGDYLYDLQLLRFYPSDAVVGVPLRLPPSEAPPSALDDDGDEGGAAAKARRAAAAASLADTSGNPAALKLSLEPGTTWESPRPPFEVSFALSAAAPAADGRLGKGEVFWQQGGIGGDGRGKAPACSSPSPSSSGEDGLITATMGDGSLPEALEAALSCVCQGETAVVSLPLAALQTSAAQRREDKRPLAFSLPYPLPRAVAASRRVELTLRLAGMVQVRDLVGPAERGNEKRGRVTKKRVKEGRGEFPADCPLGDCAVKVHVRAVALVGGEEAEGEVLWDTRTRQQEEDAGASGASCSAAAADDDGGSSSPPPPPFEFVIGTGAAPDAVDLAVCLMTPGEVSVVESDWAHARFGRKESAGATTPAGLLDVGGGESGEGGDRERARRVRFELELVEFEAPDRDPPPAARLLRSDELRAQGNAVLSSGVPRALELATGKYRRAAHLLQSALDFDTEEQHEAASRGRAAAHANLAAVALRQGRWGEALAASQRALDDEPRHAKALFRRAAALASLGRFPEADEAFGLAEEADPAAAEDVARERARVAARRKRAGEKQRREMSGFL